MNEHKWFKNGCTCHWYCDLCGQCVRKREKKTAKPCSDELRKQWQESRRRAKAMSHYSTNNTVNDPVARNFIGAV